MCMARPHRASRKAHIDYFRVESGPYHHFRTLNLVVCDETKAISVIYAALHLHSSIFTSTVTTSLPTKCSRHHYLCHTARPFDAFTKSLWALTIHLPSGPRPVKHFRHPNSRLHPLAHHNPPGAFRGVRYPRSHSQEKLHALESWQLGPGWSHPEPGSWRLGLE